MEIFPYGQTEIDYLKKKDKKLAAVIDRVGHIERAVDRDLFAAVVHHIVGQQISTKAQASIWRKMQSMPGGVTAATLLALGRDNLKNYGISYRKADYILDFAQKVGGGEFDPAAVAALSDAEAVAALSALRGVGVWTAEMILLFSLARPDVLSFGDLAIQRGMRCLYRHRKITRELFEKYRRRYSPYGSTASLYLWAVAGNALPELTDPGAKKAAGK